MKIVKSTVDSLIWASFMVYRVTTGTELMDTEPFAPRGNEGLGSCEPLVILTTNQYIILLYVLSVSKKP